MVNLRNIAGNAEEELKQGFTELTEETEHK